MLNQMVKVLMFFVCCTGFLLFKPVFANRSLQETLQKVNENTNQFKHSELIQLTWRGNRGIRRGYRPRHPVKRLNHRHKRPGRYHHRYRNHKRWVWGLPAAALVLYYLSGKPVYACRAKYNGLYYEGEARKGGPCRIVVNGRRVNVSKYMFSSTR